MQVKRCARLLVFVVRGLEGIQQVSIESISSEGFTCSSPFKILCAASNNINIYKL